MDWLFACSYLVVRSLDLYSQDVVVFYADRNVFVDTSFLSLS